MKFLSCWPVTVICGTLKACVEWLHVWDCRLWVDELLQLERFKSQAWPNGQNQMVSLFELTWQRCSRSIFIVRLWDHFRLYMFIYYIYVVYMKRSDRIRLLIMYRHDVESSAILPMVKLERSLLKFGSSVPSTLLN